MNQNFGINKIRENTKDNRKVDPISVGTAANGGLDWRVFNLYKQILEHMQNCFYRYTDFLSDDIADLKEIKENIKRADRRGAQ